MSSDERDTCNVRDWGSGQIDRIDVAGADIRACGERDGGQVGSRTLENLDDCTSMTSKDKETCERTLVELSLGHLRLQ